MRLALKLARRGQGRTKANPLVGAVIVDNGHILATGWHRAWGKAHAEIDALNAARKAGHHDLSLATLYVNLEPCCHQGKTPPCTEAIIRAGIGTVVCGMEDPNPLVRGKGMSELRAAGMHIRSGICETECRELNHPFIRYMETGLPSITLKTASSLDGKIATVTGASRWISCEHSRAEVHRLRSRSDAVLTGLGTIRADNPLLTARVSGQSCSPQPVRVIIDSRLQIPPESAILATALQFKTIIAVRRDLVEHADADFLNRMRMATEAGAEVLPVNQKDGHIDLVCLARLLADRGFLSILLEAGNTLGNAALHAGIVDRVRMYIAPIIIGSNEAPSVCGDKGAITIQSAWRLHRTRYRRCGTDIVVEGTLCSPE